MANDKLLESTGNQQEDAKIFSELKDNLRNRLSLDEAKERERAANAATASDQSGNALTDEPRIKGQALAVVAVEENNGKNKQQLPKDVKLKELDLVPGVPNPPKPEHDNPVA